MPSLPHTRLLCTLPLPARYTVVRYNTRDALPDVLDDVTCVKLQRELMDWAATHPLMRRLADTRRVYAAGHSRGAKLAALTAAADPRVAALCLIDPVDVTVYAPLSDRCAAGSRLAGSGCMKGVAGRMCVEDKIYAACD
jgi:pimeloyl-ACP methyl ester carboxylesterase